jgi:hypothetical protein
MFADMLRQFEADALWAQEYQDFVREVSFAGPGESIDFADARRLYPACRSGP